MLLRTECLALFFGATVIDSDHWAANLRRLHSGKSISAQSGAHRVITLQNLRCIRSAGTLAEIPRFLTMMNVIEIALSRGNKSTQLSDLIVLEGRDHIEGASAADVGSMFASEFEAKFLHGCTEISMIIIYERKKVLLGNQRKKNWKKTYFWIYFFLSCCVITYLSAKTVSNSGPCWQPLKHRKSPWIITLTHQLWRPN